MSILVLLLLFANFSKRSKTSVSKRFAGSNTMNSTITAADLSSIQLFSSMLSLTISAVVASYPSFAM